MTHQEESQSGVSWGKLILAVLPFLFAAAIVVWLLPRLQHLPADVSETILAEGVFSDGSRVEILEAESARSLKMTSLRRQPKWQLVNSNSSSTYTMANIDFKIDNRNGLFESVEIQREIPSLLLLLRVSDKSGTSVISENVYFARDAEFARIKRDSVGIFDKFEKITAGSLPSSNPEYEIEVEDGGGGWLKMSGPFAIDGLDGRAFAVISVFPRRSATLKLRVKQDGLPSPVELEIPNPGHDPAGFLTWTIDPKPWRKELSEVAVVVDEIKELTHSKTKRVLPRPRFRIEPPANQSPDAFTLRNKRVDDETGNSANLLEFHILPGTEKLRFHGTVERNWRYVWTPREVLIVAETFWSGDNSNQTLTLLPGANQMGMKSMALAAPSPGGRETWHFNFSGSSPRRVLPKRFAFVVFLGDEETSVKGSTSVNGSSSSSPSGITTYEYLMKWSGKIPPGQKVRVGVLPDSNPEEFEFILPIDRKFTQGSAPKEDSKP